MRLVHEPPGLPPTVGRRATAPSLEPPPALTPAPSPRPSVTAMRTPNHPEGFLRFPTSTLLGTPGSVRVLRELLDADAPLAVSTLAARTRLSAQGVRNILSSLVPTGLIEELGEGRSRLYRPEVGHPLYLPIGGLFRAERERHETILDGIRSSLSHLVPSPLSAWIYGSVAREEDLPDADLELALVTPDEEVETPVHRLRELLEPIQDVQRIWISVVGLSPGDVRRLAGVGREGASRGVRRIRGARRGGAVGVRTPSGSGASAAGDRWWMRATETPVVVYGLPPDALVEALARPGSPSRLFGP